ncbi:MFS transporter [Pseudonocardia acaciae]|uniref:MFS transporter n=1 Tax=Pseudonocardia acaciae TaxID=551276 RepID=UPI00049184F6|nr:MFS transporter [Pseudonocardia acaciae]
MQGSRASRASGYPAAVGLTLLALTPFSVLSTSTYLVTDQMAADLHTGRSGVQLSQALANAGYALFVVVAAALARRLPARTLGVAGQSAAAVGALLCACSPGLGTFTSGRVLHAAATGTMLVVALPPLVTGQPPNRMPATVVFLNVGLFGAATLGPSLGGLASGWHAWRALFGLAAALAVAGAVPAARTLDRARPERPRTRTAPAVVLAAAATIPSFLGVSLLGRQPPTSAEFLVPTGVGLAALVVLVVSEYRRADPVLAVRAVAHTLPVIGICNAMLAGAGFTLLTEVGMALLVQVEHRSPWTVSATMSTLVLGMAGAAWLFRSTLRSRWLPATVIGGLLAVAAAGATLAGLGSVPGPPLVAAAGLLLGFGAGAGVAPGLLLAALSVPGDELAGAFGLVQLLRIQGAFLVGPIVPALLAAPDPMAAIGTAAIAVAAVALLGAVALTALLLAGGARPHSPDVHAWVHGQSAGFHSPRLGGLLRDDPDE